MAFRKWIESLTSRSATREARSMVMGWPGFPPLPPGTSEDDLEEYLYRCDVAEVVVNAESHVTVTLLDPDHQRWIFNFGRAGLEVESYYPDVHGNSGPKHGITGMFTETFDTDRDEVHRGKVIDYTVEGPVGLTVQGRSVEVIPPQ